MVIIIDDAEWVPVYVGKRRGKCSTRKHKTHNRKAIRYERRHGRLFDKIASGGLSRIGGVLWISSGVQK